MDVKINTNIKTRSVAQGMVGAVLSCQLVLTGCSSNNHDDYVDNTLLRTQVLASEGGTFTSGDQSIMVTIPAGALDKDTELVIKPASGMAGEMNSMMPAGEAYSISVGDAELSSMMTIVLHLDDAPMHPQLGEVALQEGDVWSRVSRNFYRASEGSVVVLVDDDGVFQPILRTLQAETGDGVARGENIFLYETFQNEDFFGGVLGLHTLLNELTPAAAVGAGVQVDLAKVPQGIVDVLLGDDFDAKQDALQNPAITRALLKAGAVVGVKAVFDGEDDELLSSAGITCALCHVNVATTEFELSAGEMTALPIGGLQLNGVPNTTMDAGLILSLTPFAENAGQGTVDFLQSFGPGNFDVRALPDNPLEDNVANPTNYPPLWNFVDLAQQDYVLNWDGLFSSSGDTELALASQAEAVYDLVMHANGAFGVMSGSVAPQLSITPPEALLTALGAAEDAAPGNDIPEQALLDVQAWERSIVSPAPGDYDEALAEEGFELFNGKADCSGCHMSAEFTGPVLSTNIVLPAPEGGLAGGIKTPGLRGLTYTAPYFHDGSAETLMDVMDAYSGRIVDALTQQEKEAVVEYLKTL